MFKFIIIIFLSIYCYSSDVFTVTTQDTMRLDFNNINVNNINFKIDNATKKFEIYNGNKLIKTMDNIKFSKYTIINKNNELSYIELKISNK